MADEPAPPPATPTKVIVIAGGVSVTVEAAEPLAVVEATARRLHHEAQVRCVGRSPAGFGGAL